MIKEYWKGGNMIYPVPAVMVSCGKENEIPNIITIAWTGTCCTNPPMAYISVRPERYSYKIIEETKSKVALVNKYVLLPFSLLSIGPKIDNVPMQKRRIAVERPSANLEPPFAFCKRPWNLPFKSSHVPSTVPMARLAIKSTGYSLFGILLTNALTPNPMVAKPNASNRAVLYFSFIPRLTKLPITEPDKMQPTFTIVPNIM